MLHYNKDLKQFSRQLRRKMTDAEKLLWSKIRAKQLKGIQFYRQKTIGNFIVDFYCPKANLIIEVDGGQHYVPEGKEKDRQRDRILEGMGLTVLRFSDREVFENGEAVLGKIWEYL
ncbi:MAG: endonuclease domain-containing protein [Nitrospirota bacterium]